MMLLASLGFSLMSVAVKLASAEHGAGEIVFYRGLMGAVLIAAITPFTPHSLRTPVLGMHVWRSASGVGALVLWIASLSALPLATASTLNYMSTVWMALFMLGGAWLTGRGHVDGRLVAAVLAGFVGVALMLRPTLDQQQLWYGLAGLGSGILAALAYLQITVMGRAGEPDQRMVFYFSLGGMAGGGALAWFEGWHALSASSAGWLLAVGVSATLAQMAMTRAYTLGNTLMVGCLQYSGIVFAFGLGVWLFDDPLTPLAMAGMALIIAAGVGATWLRGNTVPRAPQSD